jgi:hypothetical protein
MKRRTGVAFGDIRSCGHLRSIVPPHEEMRDPDEGSRSHSD